MYVVLVGPSGKCRKGTAMTPGFNMLSDLKIPLAAEATTREALIQELEKSNDTIVDPLSGTMDMHSSLTIYSQELTVFLGYHNLQLMSDLTDWYDCRPIWTYRTKHQGTDQIIGVWVNLFGATTPDLIQAVMPRSAIGGGLTSRIIFVYEDKKGKLVADPFLTKDEMGLRDDLMHDLERISIMSGQFKVTSKFIEKWIPLYTNMEKSRSFNDPRFDGYFERRANHLLKLSIILCASRSDRMIIEDRDLKRADAILTRTERKMKWTFSGVGKSDTAEVMSRIMSIVAMKGEVLSSEVYSLVHYDVDDRGFAGILKALERMKWCRVIPIGGKHDSLLRYEKGEADGKDDGDIGLSDK